MLPDAFVCTGGRFAYFSASSSIHGGDEFSVSAGVVNIAFEGVAIRICIWSVSVFMLIIPATRSGLPGLLAGLISKLRRRIEYFDCFGRRCPVLVSAYWLPVVGKWSADCRSSPVHNGSVFTGP